MALTPLDLPVHEEISPVPLHDMSGISKWPKDLNIVDVLEILDQKHGPIQDDPQELNDTRLFLIGARLRNSCLGGIWRRIKRIFSATANNRMDYGREDIDYWSIQMTGR